MPKGKKIRKRKERRLLDKAKVYIHSSFNNTLVTIADDDGNVLTWSSAGTRGLKGAKKGTAFAAQMAAEAAGRKAQEFGVKEVAIYARGPGSGKDAAIRTINSLGFRVTLIRDVTPVPHNGCRPKKRRRV